MRVTRGVLVRPRDALGAVVGSDGRPVVSDITEGSLAGSFHGGVTDVFLARLDP